MKLLNRKMHTFYVSNIVLSFTLSCFLGVNYCLTEEDTVSNNSEVLIVDTEIEPLSQLGEDKQKAVVEVKKESNTTKKNTNKTKVATVTKQEVRASKTYVPATYSEVTGQAVVDYAMKYLGLRYVANGYSLSTGTDCSGFTKLIYAEFGVTLSRAVKAQASNGSYVSKADLQKGDLVFYGYGNGVIRHVGIYIGNGQVLHESTPKSGVKISSVNMMQYITARRVINSTAIKMVEEKIEAEKQQEVILDTDNQITEEKNENVINEEIIIDNTSNQDIVQENIVSDSISEENLVGEQKESLAANISTNSESNQNIQENIDNGLNEKKEEIVEEIPKDLSVTDTPSEAVEQDKTSNEEIPIIEETNLNNTSEN